MAALLSLDALLGLATLTLMEIVLGIDNIVFIAILVAKLPAAQQPLARRLGLTLALGIRVALLLTISWIMRLTAPFLTVWEVELSGRSLILLGGGLFLIFKATREVYDKVEGGGHQAGGEGPTAAFGWVMAQILLLDIVFSLDSVITAVGMANQVSVMITAMVLAMLVMLASAGAVSGFVERHPSVKILALAFLLLDIVFSLDSVITAVGMANQVPVMITAMVLAMLVMLASASAVSGFVERHPSIKILALAFLLLIGVMLVAEGMGTHVAKGYVYFAMAFSLFVEMLNMRYRRRRSVGGTAGPVHA